jgi:hypothetical protein
VRDSQTSRSTSESISPSDSISRFDSDGRTSKSGQSAPLSGRNVLMHQPATRPSEYPVEVLWSLDDCKADPDVNVSATNTSRPPLERAIRHGDGTMITASEWAAIKATARMVKLDLLSLPPSRDRRARDRTKSKVYFRTHFRKEWDAAVARMESLQPLLALCSSHWKAEHALGNTLLVKVVTDSEEDESDSPAENVDKSPGSDRKKRRAKGRSGEKKRRKKDRETSRPSTGEAPNDKAGETSNDETGGLSNDKAGGISNDKAGRMSNDKAGGMLNDKAGGTSNDNAGATSNDKRHEPHGKVGETSNNTGSKPNGSGTPSDEASGVANGGTDGALGNKAGGAGPGVGKFLVGMVYYNSC